MRSWMWMSLLLAGAALGASGWVTEYNPVHHRPQAAPAAAAVIVKLRDQSLEGKQQLRPGRQRIQELAARHGMPLHATREITEHLHVLKLASTQDASVSAKELQDDPEVEFVEPDQLRYPHAAPNDSLFATQQWYMQQNSASLPAPSAVDAVTAWDSTTGTSGIVIADLDTGVRFDHPELLWAASGPGRILPGYDFVSDPFMANDGDGWDPDPSDPGDWVTSSDLKQTQCSTTKKIADSSWHGTRTAGILGAITNNMQGIAGMTWQGWILPVRVLGKCGGYDSDIVTAMLWAAGIHVSGVPDNPYPAKVENLSLGGTAACPKIYQDAVSQLSALGVLVVASAGNEGGPVDTPANCAGVAGVAGLRHVGTKVGYSNVGPEISLGAPAGNCVNNPVTAQSPCLYPITSTTNDGTKGPGTNTYTDQVNNPNLGTSFSAPIVSGIAGLMLSVNANLRAAQLISRLKEGAVTYPQNSADATIQPPFCHVPTSASDLQNNECLCTRDSQTCGAGMANAAGAINAALRPIAAVTRPGAYAAGQVVALDAAGSAAACNHSIVAYSWLSLDPAHPVSQSTGTRTTVTTPISQPYDVVLTVIDEQGRHDQATITMGLTGASSAAPTSAGSSPCLAAISVPSPVTVTITPTSAAVVTGSGTTLAFSATVTKTLNTAVRWNVNGVSGGNASVGTISSNGVYTPPATASGGSVTVSAVSVADPTKSAQAQVSVSNPHSGGGGAFGWELVGLALLAARRSAEARGSQREAMRSARSSQLR